MLQLRSAYGRLIRSSSAALIVQGLSCAGPNASHGNIYHPRCERFAHRDTAAAPTLALKATAAVSIYLERKHSCEPGSSRLAIVPDRFTDPAITDGLGASVDELAVLSAMPVAQLRARGSDLAGPLLQALTVFCRCALDDRYVLASRGLAAEAARLCADILGLSGAAQYASPPQLAPAVRAWCAATAYSCEPTVTRDGRSATLRPHPWLVRTAITASGREQCTEDEQTGGSAEPTRPSGLLDGFSRSLPTSVVPQAETARAVGFNPPNTDRPFSTWTLNEMCELLSGFDCLLPVAGRLGPLRAKITAFESESAPLLFREATPSHSHAGLAAVALHEELHCGAVHLTEWPPARGLGSIDEAHALARFGTRLPASESRPALARVPGLSDAHVLASSRKRDSFDAGTSLLTRLFSFLRGPQASSVAMPAAASRVDRRSPVSIVRYLLTHSRPYPSEAHRDGLRELPSGITADAIRSVASLAATELMLRLNREVAILGRSSPASSTPSVDSASLAELGVELIDDDVSSPQRGISQSLQSGARRSDHSRLSLRLPDVVALAFLAGSLHVPTSHLLWARAGAWAVARFGNRANTVPTADNNSDGSPFATLAHVLAVFAPGLASSRLTVELAAMRLLGSHHSSSIPECATLAAALSALILACRVGSHREDVARLTTLLQRIADIATYRLSAPVWAVADTAVKLPIGAAVPGASPPFAARLQQLLPLARAFGELRLLHPPLFAAVHDALCASLLGPAGEPSLYGVSLARLTQLFEASRLSYASAYGLIIALCDELADRRSTSIASARFREVLDFCQSVTGYGVVHAPLLARFAARLDARLIVWQGLLATASASGADMDGKAATEALPQQWAALRAPAGDACASLHVLILSGAYALHPSTTARLLTFIDACLLSLAEARGSGALKVGEEQPSLAFPMSDSAPPMLLACRELLPVEKATSLLLCHHALGAHNAAVARGTSAGAEPGGALSSAVLVGLRLPLPLEASTLPVLSEETRDALGALIVPRMAAIQRSEFEAAVSSVALELAPRLGLPPPQRSVPIGPAPYVYTADFGWPSAGIMVEADGPWHFLPLPASALNLRSGHRVREGKLFPAVRGFSPFAPEVRFHPDLTRGWSGDDVAHTPLGPIVVPVGDLTRASVAFRDGRDGQYRPSHAASRALRLGDLLREWIVTTTPLTPQHLLSVVSPVPLPASLPDAVCSPRGATRRLVTLVRVPAYDWDQLTSRGDRLAYLQQALRPLCGDTTASSVRGLAAAVAAG